MEELSHQLLVGPAEHLLCAGIGECGPAFAIDQKQCFGCIVRDGIGQIQLILEQLFRLFESGVISNDLCQTPESVVLVSQAEHDTVGPEAGAILAYVPPGVLSSAGFRGESRLALRFTPKDVLGNKEDGAVPPDDLFAGESKDPLGAGIPGFDSTVETNVEDGVVYRGLDN